MAHPRPSRRAKGRSRRSGFPTVRPSEWIGPTGRRRGISASRQHSLEMQAFTYERLETESPAMSLPRVRLTIRRMMILVAVVAVILGGGFGVFPLKRQRDHYLERAALHALKDAAHQEMAVFYRDGFVARDSRLLVREQHLARSKRWMGERRSSPGLSPEVRDRMVRSWAENESRNDEIFVEVQREASLYRRKRESSRHSAAYHASLKQKYFRAAALPWETVPPDPPESK